MLATFVVLFFHITGCSDTWSMKALRTGGLAQFKVPVYDSVPWTKLESAIPSGDNVKLFVTHAGYGQGMPYYSKEENTVKSLSIPSQTKFLGYI